MEYNIKEQLMKGLFILFFCITIILGDYIYRISLNSKAANNIVINEVVNFKEFNSDRITPFQVKEDGKLDITAKADVQKGGVSIFIMSPDHKIIYKKSGQKFDERKVIDVNNGVWYYRVLCDNANNGSYSIIGKLEK